MHFVANYFPFKTQKVKVKIAKRCRSNHCVLIQLNSFLAQVDGDAERVFSLNCEVKVEITHCPKFHREVKRKALEFKQA